LNDKPTAGWRVQEVDEVHQLRPGLLNVANQVMGHLIRFLEDPSSIYVAGPGGRNLKDNPYWSEELASRAPELARRRHLLLLSVALSKTQNDRGRRPWTLFGASEQGPERAFWNSFYTAPGDELPVRRWRAISADLSAVQRAAGCSSQRLSRRQHRPAAESAVPVVLGYADLSPREPAAPARDPVLRAAAHLPP
jgi:hypothetical protein